MSSLMHMDQDAKRVLKRCGGIIPTATELVTYGAIDPSTIKCLHKNMRELYDPRLFNHILRRCPETPVEMVILALHVSLIDGSEDKVRRTRGICASLVLPTSQ